MPIIRIHYLFSDRDNASTSSADEKPMAMSAPQSTETKTEAELTGQVAAQTNPVWLTTGMGEMFSAPADGTAAAPAILDDFFMNRLHALANAGASDAELDREGVLGLCVRWLEEQGFSADDLRFILVIITMFWNKHPAALFETLRSAAAEPLAESR